MAFTDVYSRIFGHTDFDAGGFIVTNEKLTQNPAGWDVLTLEIWGIMATAPTVTTDSSMDALLRTTWPLGTAHTALGLIDWTGDADSLFFVQDADLEQDGPPHCYRGTLKLLGVINAEKPKAIQVDSIANEYEGKNISIAGVGGPYARVATQECDVTVSFTYPVIGTAAATDSVGETATPPWVPDLAASHWSTLADPLLHWPSGWIIERMPIQLLVGVADYVIHYRTDHYIHRNQYTP